MKTRKDVVLEWCRENKIKYLTHHSASDMDCSHIYGVVKEEDVKNVIGGFDAEQNYHKLPADIFKVKVIKTKEGYMHTNGKYKTGIYSNGENDSIYYSLVNMAPYRKVTITWEELEEIE